VQVYIFILWWEAKEKEKITNCTFFCLDAKERYQRKIAESPYVRHPQASLRLLSLKRAFQGCTSGATPKVFSAKGQELASLKQPALLNAENTFYA
jgi:hypothetical protein